MQTLFHVSRRRKLSRGAVLDIKPRIVPGRGVDALQQHLDSMFPHGLSEHGSHFLAEPASVVELDEEGRHDASAAIELVFEYVRRARFPDRPSRYESYFGFETAADAKAFRTKFGSPSAEIWEVECARSFRADMRCLEFLDRTALVVSYFAELYWAGLPFSSGRPQWEYLMMPPVGAVKRVDLP